ncbi:MAG TPA: hypothetical protein QGH10_26835 [Armatimonadota bacterium]|nr:hypothetical protein [Armatimonadota bacterium]
MSDGDGGFSLVKILVLDDEAVHVRLYRESYATRPTEVDPAELDYGGDEASGSFGVGHVPVERKGFDAWEPELVMETTVEPEELEGYNIWKESGEEVHVEESELTEEPSG